MIMFIFLSSTYIYHLHPSYIFVLIFIVMVYACFLACYDYAVLALISFLPYAPITVEPICFERTFKIINIYHHLELFLKYSYIFLPPEPASGTRSKPPTRWSRWMKPRAITCRRC